MAFRSNAILTPSEMEGTRRWLHVSSFLPLMAAKIEMKPEHRQDQFRILYHQHLAISTVALVVRKPTLSIYHICHMIL